MFASLSDGGDGGVHTRLINSRVGRVNGSCQIVLTENVRNQTRNQGSTSLPRTSGFFTVIYRQQRKVIERQDLLNSPSQ